MAKFDNFKGKSNTNGFDKNPESIKKSGLNSSSIKTHTKRMLEGDGYVMIQNAEVVDETGTPTGEIVNVRSRITNAEAVSVHYMNRAKKSDRVLIHLVEMIDGKPQASIDVTTGGESINIPLIEWVKTKDKK